MDSNNRHWKIPMWQKIAVVIGIVATILIMLFAEGCAHRPKFCRAVGNLQICAYDTDFDGRIDTWQHWGYMGGEWVPVLYPIKVKRGE